MNDALRVQELVHEWFCDYPTWVVIDITKIFAFGEKPEDQSKAILFEKFLEDMAFTNGWLDIQLDLAHPDRHFNRAPGSTYAMQHGINVALLVESFNRLKDLM